jgi:hypothetical protein
MGAFEWIREGVRRAVLLGFSDAVEQLGAPARDDQLHPQLAAVLHQPAAKAVEARATLALAPSAGGRKRLGKSLEAAQREAA